ncbi:SDR family oxidoreductase [Virgibacillus siamensis]|uniref:SDR family oxidoreductase n=1 Tax=Virgibacillus siamensis TaxID=480071 RepID=UPI000984DDCF|nr:SDR family oxidoreductase [Virgibacillus siamensis]
MKTYFITGFPGFLASNLIKQLLYDRNEINQIYVLSLPSLEEKAAEEISLLAQNTNTDHTLFSVVTGDITQPALDLDPQINRKLQESVTHVFHLAAIYDLAVPKDIAYRVNVNGTGNMNDWVKTLLKLERYIYFSTAYVSGTREGKIYETELSMNQPFKNHYEETKYHAEVLVDKLKQTLPVTIIRPGIVKGHSKTGFTTKFDGLYFMLNLMENLNMSPILPYFGNGTPEGNFVPYDYVLQATSYLAHASAGVGKTYHLTDPNPYTMDELYNLFAKAYLGKTPIGKIPVNLTKNMLIVPFIRKWLQVEMQAMDYFTIHASFDSTLAQNDLKGSGITCPDLRDTIEPMIQFYRMYKHDRSMHIAIK